MFPLFLIDVGIELGNGILYVFFYGTPVRNGNPKKICILFSAIFTYILILYTEFFTWKVDLCIFFTRFMYLWLGPEINFSCQNFRIENSIYAGILTRKAGEKISTNFRFTLLGSAEKKKF